MSRNIRNHLVGIKRKYYLEAHGLKIECFDIDVAIEEKI